MVINRRDTSVPTVKVVNEKRPDAFKIINEIDFIPGKHVLWENRNDIVEDVIETDEDDLGQKTLVNPEDVIAANALIVEEERKISKAAAKKAAAAMKLPGETAEVDQKEGVFENTEVVK